MERKTKKLDEFKTVRKFIKDLMNDETELTDKKFLELCQKTWVHTAKNKSTVFGVLKERVLVGKPGVRLRKVLSDNCTIVEVTTDTGIYSAKVICESEPYKPTVEGDWGVNPLSFHKLR